MATAAPTPSGLEETSETATERATASPCPLTPLLLRPPPLLVETPPPLLLPQLLPMLPLLLLPTPLLPSPHMPLLPPLLLPITTPLPATPLPLLSTTDMFTKCFLCPLLLSVSIH